MDTGSPEGVDHDEPSKVLTFAALTTTLESRVFDEVRLLLELVILISIFANLWAKASEVVASGVAVAEANRKSFACKLSAVLWSVDTPHDVGRAALYAPPPYDQAVSSLDVWLVPQ